MTNGTDQPQLQDLDRELLEVFEKLENQPDALAAVRAVAFVDDALKFLLENQFVDKKTADAFLSGPVRSLASRANIARSLELISAEDRSDIDKLCKIRNLCAHTFHEIDLSDAVFSEKTKHLSAWKFWTEEREQQDRGTSPKRSKERLLLSAAVIAKDIVSPIGATRPATKEETRKFVQELFREGRGEFDSDDGV